MPMYNAKLQKQNAIFAAVVSSIGYYHEISEMVPGLEDYNQQLSRYVWTLNVIDIGNMLS